MLIEHENPDTPQPSPKKSHLGFYLFLILILGAGGAGYWFYKNNFSDLVPASIITTTQSPQTFVPPSSDDKIKTLEDKMTALEEKIGALQTHNQNPPANTSLLIAFVQLRAMVSGGQSFDQALNHFTALAGNNIALMDAITTLQPIATKGAMTNAEIRAQYKIMQPAVEAIITQSTATTWQERIKLALGNLITIHKIDAPINTNPKIMQIETALAQNQLAHSIQSISALPLEAQKHLAPLTEQIKNRLEIEESMQKITSILAPIPTQNKGEGM